MQTIIVNPSKVVAEYAYSPVGINLDYLMDSDANRPGARPIVGALREMGARWLRYPGGGKSDMHLWSARPWEKPAPQVFGAYREYSAGSTLMDFDEYMATVRGAGAEAFVVVGHKLEAKSGISRAAYLENAVEWVRYANVKKGYGVRYWEIGNENWLNAQMTPEEAADAVVEFSAAMKAVDPTIRVGANGFGKEWWAGFLPKAAGSLDFVTLSNYPCSTWMGYDWYREHAEVVVIEQVGIAAEAIAALPEEADRRRLFIVVTELNSMDYAEGGWPNRNNLGHALVTVEIIGRAIAHPKVRAAMLWNTRWVLPEPETIWYGLGVSNEILPSGRAVAVWGQFLRDRLVEVSRTDSVVTFASASSATGEVNVLLINKGLAGARADVRVASGRGYESARVYRFGGAGPDDMQPVWQEQSRACVRGNAVEGLELPGVSLTVVSLA